MKRRDFLEKAGYGAAGIAAAPLAHGGEAKKELVVRNYDMEIEVVENGPETRCHMVGEKYQWPKERGKLCTWLTSALDPMVTALSSGGTLPWGYRGTPYEKVIDPDGVTTEFIRCPDPTEAGIVVKITRTFKSKRTIEV
jgi:uncharacterized repeat protein (TIGR04076 family)